MWCEIDAHAHFRGHIVCCVGWGISRKNLKKMTRFYITEREEVEERSVFEMETPGLKYIHLADLNLLTAISLLSWRHNNIWNLKREEKFNLHLKFCIWIHTWANMGTVSGRTGTKTEVSAGTFVELFGAVVTWKLLHIFIRAIFNETGNSTEECKFIEVPW